MRPVTLSPEFLSEIPLGSAITLQRGFDITKAEQTPGEIPIVSSSGVSSFHNKWKVAGPGVVIGRKGTLGTVHYLGENFWPHDTTLWVKDFKLSNPRFVAYFLKTLHLENFDTGASNPTLNRNHVHKIQVQYPKPAAQERIAAALSAYDDLIENNRRRIALLERMAEQLYREWFVRFRFPGYQQAKFEKGVPRDWTKAKFCDLCTLQRGFDLPDAQIVDGNYPVVASTSIKAFHYAFKVEPPVITTGRSGSLGDVLWTNERAWPLNTALYVKNFRENSPYFVFHTLRTMHLENFNSGAGVPSLNRNHLKSLPISLPPRPLQDAFANQVGPMQSLKEKLDRACVDLAKTRDLLLPRLISGKLRVDHLDIQFPPSMQTERA